MPLASQADCTPLRCDESSPVYIFPPNECDPQKWPLHRDHIQIQYDRDHSGLKDIKVKIRYVLSCAQQGNLLPYDLVDGVYLYLVKKGNTDINDLGTFPNSRKGVIIDSWPLQGTTPFLVEHMEFSLPQESLPVKFDPTQSYALEIEVKSRDPIYVVGRKRIALDEDLTQ